MQSWYWLSVLVIQAHTVVFSTLHTRHTLSKAYLIVTKSHIAEGWKHFHQSEFDFEHFRKHVWVWVILQMGVKEGVIFLSYSSLISGCDNGQTRLDQLMDWCGSEFDGLVVFDECHKAKNLVPESGARPTKVGRLVLELQQKLPGARVVYCSATGTDLFHTANSLLFTDIIWKLFDVGRVLMSYLGFRCSLWETKHGPEM